MLLHTTRGEFYQVLNKTSSEASDLKVNPRVVVGSQLGKYLLPRKQHLILKMLSSSTIPIIAVTLRREGKYL